MPPVRGHGSRLSGCSYSRSTLNCKSQRKGRALAIAFDSTWRWVLTPKDTAELQRRFWRQVALYLAAPKGHIWITTDRAAYDLRRLKRRTRSDVVEVTAGVEDASGLPLTEAPIEATVNLVLGHLGGQRVHP